MNVCIHHGFYNLINETNIEFDIWFYNSSKTITFSTQIYSTFRGSTSLVKNETVNDWQQIRSKHTIIVRLNCNPGCAFWFCLHSKPGVANVTLKITKVCPLPLHWGFDLFVWFVLPLIKDKGKINGLQREEQILGRMSKTEQPWHQRGRSWKGHQVQKL